MWSSWAVQRTLSALFFTNGAFFLFLLNGRKDTANLLGLLHLCSCTAAAMKPGRMRGTTKRGSVFQRQYADGGSGSHGLGGGEDAKCDGESVDMHVRCEMLGYS
jgi:hypothetical protein